MSEEEVYQIEEWIEETKIMKFQNQRKGNENEKDFCKHWQILNKLNKGKALHDFVCEVSISGTVRAPL